MEVRKPVWLMGINGQEVFCPDDGVISEMCGSPGGKCGDGYNTKGKCDIFYVDRAESWIGTRIPGKMIECEKGAVTGLCTSDGQYDCAGDIQRLSCNDNVIVDKAVCSSVE